MNLSRDLPLHLRVVVRCVCLMLRAVRPSAALCRLEGAALADLREAERRAA